jgi:putative acetyltransferase
MRAAWRSDYYRRFGFRTVPGLVLPGVPAEYCPDFRRPAAARRVSYHRAFNARD